jgi:phage shock protein E
LQCKYVKGVGKNKVEKKIKNTPMKPSKLKSMSVIKLTLVSVVLIFAGFKFFNSNAQESNLKTIEAKEFAGLTKNNEAVIIDFRTSDEFNSGHIPNALNIDYYSDLNDKITALDTSKIYLVYCQSGNRSGKAALIMAEKGFSRIYNLKNGIPAWKRAGFPVIYK